MTPALISGDGIYLIISKEGDELSLMNLWTEYKNGKVAIPKCLI